MANPRVACPGEPLVLLADQAHPWVAGGNLRGVVGGAVVDHDDLEVGVALIQYALYGLAQEVRLVVAGDDHRHQRRIRLPLPSGLAGAAPNALGVLRAAVVLRHILNFPSTLARTRSSLFDSLRALEACMFCSSSFNR